MPLRPAHRLPRKFNRPISSVTRRVLDRRLRHSIRGRIATLWKRSARSFQRNREGWRISMIRWSIVTVVALVLLTFGIVLFSPIGRIEEIHVPRTDTRLDIEGVIESLSPLFGRYLISITGREVSDLIVQKIPDVQNITVSKRYPSQLTVRVELETLVARIRVLDPDRGDRPVSGSGGTIHAVTRSGILTAYAPSTSSGALPLIDLVDWGVQPENGVPILTPEILTRIVETEQALTIQFGYKVSRRVLYLRAQEYHLTVGGIRLWFDIRSTVEEQLQRLRTYLHVLGPGVAKQYIDLRLGDKVIYQ
ncbi:MAG: FtsQ-type POTRA domain-containing protein [Candidatus Peregrinibacteria bacterium]